MKCKLGISDCTDHAENWRFKALLQWTQDDEELRPQDSGRSQLLLNQNWHLVTTVELSDRNLHSVCYRSRSECCQNTLCAYLSVWTQFIPVYKHMCGHVWVCMWHGYVLKHTPLRVHREWTCISVCGYTCLQGHTFPYTPAYGLTGAHAYGYTCIVFFYTICY